jgi:monoamine oxidase
VVAVPFTHLHQIQIEPPLSEDRWQAILTLRMGQYAVVHLVVDKAARALWLRDGKSPFPVLTDGPLGVVYGPPGGEPGGGRELFSLLVHGIAARGFHMAPREQKVAELLRALDVLWPAFSKHVKASHVYTFHPAAIPVWPPGRSPLDEGAERLRTPELGLSLAGDYLWNAHSDGAARSGIDAAARIAAELGGR